MGSGAASTVGCVSIQSLPNFVVLSAGIQNYLTLVHLSGYFYTFWSFVFFDLVSIFDVL